MTRALRAARPVALLLVLVLGGIAVARQRHEVGAGLGRLGVLAVLEAFVLVTAAIACAVPSWRAIMREVGPPLRLDAAASIFLLGQLGKFAPGGSVWVVVAQTELGRRYGVPRRAAATGGIVALGVQFATAVVLAAAALPLASAQLRHDYWWVSLLALPATAGLHPRVLNPVLDRALRLLRRVPLERPLSLRGIATAAGWSLLGWLLYGVHAWVLARGLAGTDPMLFARAVGGFALAWTLGFLVVVVPAGGGTRDAVLVTVFSSVLAPGAPLALALASRLLVTVADLVGGGVGLLLGRLHAPPPSVTSADDDAGAPLRGLAPTSTP